MVLETKMAEEIVLKAACSSVTSHSVAGRLYRQKLSRAAGNPVGMAAVGREEAASSCGQGMSLPGTEQRVGTDSDRPESSCEDFSKQR